MGKSATATLFRALKVPVFDSDACVHDLLEGRAREEIQRIFPSVWDKTTQTIDRQALGRIIFADISAKEKLEAILHPMIWEEQNQFISACRRAGYAHIVLDIPLLFETGRDRICDFVICVTAPAFLQKRRVLSRKGMTSEKYKAILKSQMPDREKRQLADYVVQTGLGRAFTLQKLKDILKSTT